MVIGGFIARAVTGCKLCLLSRLLLICFRGDCAVAISVVDTMQLR